MAVAAPADHDTLLRAAGLPHQDAVAALDRLYRSGWPIADRDTGNGDLVHDLLRDTVLAQMSPVAVAQRHADAATALMALHRDDPALPRHIVAAGSLLRSTDAVGYRTPTTRR